MFATARASLRAVLAAMKMSIFLVDGMMLMRHHRIFGVENGRNGTDERWECWLVCKVRQLGVFKN
jgi:hypothetical protein